jgi:hypothetical protein
MIERSYYPIPYGCIPYLIIIVWLIEIIEEYKKLKEGSITKVMYASIKNDRIIYLIEFVSVVLEIMKKDKSVVFARDDILRKCKRCF